MEDYKGQPEARIRTAIVEVTRFAQKSCENCRGARWFLVAILPTEIPQFANAGRRANPDLETIPAEERVKHPDIRIANSQWGAFFDEVIANPAKYGLTDTTAPCSDRPFGPQKIATCPDPGAHFFYHEGHPSTAAHRVVGDMLYREATTKAP